MITKPLSHVQEEKLKDEVLKLLDRKDFFEALDEEIRNMVLDAMPSSFSPLNDSTTIEYAENLVMRIRLAFLAAQIAKFV
jgi:hypothetical protein